MKRPATGLATLALVLAGCAPGPGSVVHSFKDGDVTTAAHLAKFAGGSAGRVLATGFQLAFAFTHAPPPGSCLKVTDDGTTLKVVAKGCTRNGGNPWYGSLTFVRSGGSRYIPSSRPGVQPIKIDFGTVSFDGFGQTVERSCPGQPGVVGLFATKTTGTASIAADGDTRARFTVDLESKAVDGPRSCLPKGLVTAVEYQGSVTFETNDSETLAGTGTFGTSAAGQVSVTTQGEVIDPGSCDASEAIGGTTTFRAGGHTAVVSHHGNLRQCTTQTTWTLDGKNEGTVDTNAGMDCAAAPGRGGMPGLLSALTVLGLALLRRRRAPRGG